MVNPCTTCVDLHRTCPCPAYRRWDTEPTPCAVCAEAAWQVFSGELLEQVAARMCAGGTRHRCGPGQGCRPVRLDSLRTHLARHGRDDLLDIDRQRRVLL